MSFLDTLKSLGLWQGQQPQAAQPNPYGLDPQAVSQARMAALGNIGGQILAMSQQMTPDQRARMMAQADWTGGYQTNLYNQAQMQLMSDAQKRKQIETQRAEEARASIAEMIKKTPAGRVRDAAMYFFQAGDYGKAGELLFKQERRLNPMGFYETVDAFGNPINSGAAAMPQAGSAPAAVPMPATGGDAHAPGPAPLPAPDAGASPMPQADAGADQLTLNWRRLTGDPNLTPAEARQISMAAVAENDPAAGLKVYRELAKQRIDQSNTEETQSQTALNNERNAAEKLRADYDAAGKAYSTVIGAAEYAANVATQPDRSPADKLAVLYNYIKTLDPLGAVRDSDIELAQSIQPAIARIEQMFESVSQGGTISDAAILQIARTMAGLGNDAKGRLGRKEQEIRRTAAARKVNPNMVFGEPIRGPQGPQPPIGYRIPRAESGDNVELPPEDEDYVGNWTGGM